MSLEQLIHTVSQKLSINDEKSLEKITTIGDSVRNELFNTEKLENYELGKVEIEKIINEMMRISCINRYISYECETHDCVGLAVTQDDKCEYCSEVLKDSKSHNITNYSYRLSKEFLMELKEHKTKEIERYILRDFTLNMEALSESSHQVIPFIGAGVSIPFGLKSWADLLKELEKGLNNEDKVHFETLISRGDYLRALSFLKTYSGYYKQEKIIKDDIKRIIEQTFNKNIDDNQHNVLDLIKLNSNFYITTNYDNSLNYFLRDYRDDYDMPYTLKDIEDLQDFFNGRQKVLHLHGHINKTSTMIVTKEDYDSLYTDIRTSDILKSIMANKKLLFIGFSFNDKYFKDLYDSIRSTIGGEHFIIVPNLHVYDAGEYIENGLIPIGVKVEKDEQGRNISSEYVQGIKIVLEQLV